ncbi:nuclear transport factor 2 family protein [Halobacteriales archaeon Cl-PHB]
MKAPTDPVAVARTYYRALDESDYDLLEGLLDPEFVQERPDRTLDGRDRFVEFMRDERPQTDTTHELDGVYLPSGVADEASASEVVVRGWLLDADDEPITGFVDVFSLEGENVASLVTYTN